MTVISVRFAALTAALVLAFFFTRSITRPIGLAVSVAQAVAKGDLTSDIRVDRGDETSQLLAALNMMIEKVSEVVYSRPLRASLQSQCCPILHFNAYPARADDVRGRYFNSLAIDAE